jgi:hypothetical protein
MENTEIVSKVIENAKDAYSFVKENGLAEPLVNSAKTFIKWFSGLFTRKSHINRLKLMEDQKAMENDISMLSDELLALIEENEKRKVEFQKKIDDIERAKGNEPNQAAVEIIHSKNVIVNVKTLKVKGDFRIGDNVGVVPEKKPKND